MRRLPHLFFKTTILTDDNKLIIQTFLQLIPLPPSHVVDITLLSNYSLYSPGHQATNCFFPENIYTRLTFLV